MSDKSLETENKRLQSELELAKKELADFIYLASHELRSPVNAIANLTTWVLEDIGLNIDEESQTNLMLINSRAERLQQMITDLLMYSRVGKHSEAYSDFDFNEAVVYCVEQFDAHSFKFDIDSGRVTLPRTLFNQVINILISNAVKHHPNKRGCIKVHYEKQANMYRIFIEDDGCGIPIKNQDIIFEQFQTLRARDEVEGSGMGLAIGKKILEHQGGKITVESDGKAGSTFICHWPSNGC
ncbi:sensor histidine kinase [Pseudoalteromonas aurantia]|uniref:histidine kinase n=1 Tax=Pseudoalteromonas aurantia 208 TaxID=1314867 RepID=A0ABR9EAS0_9GAMM|nr:HAMP domain-containing sensor histidine kinase [Pseudoalteromonas aurantia]MBE0368085.1 hypothetical protein [Pseudoalteromonas aurantia 208]